MLIPDNRVSQAPPCFMTYIYIDLLPWHIDNYVTNNNKIETKEMRMSVWNRQCHGSYRSSGNEWF